MIETFPLSDLELPTAFVALCDHYAVVTLIQALDLIQRLLEHPNQLPDGITIEMLEKVQILIQDYLPATLLEHLHEPVPLHPLNGLILQAPIVSISDLKGTKHAEGFSKELKNILTQETDKQTPDKEN